MKKIYYLQKIEVELGDLIAYKGFKTTVTEELIKLNPELFKVEENIQPIYFKSLKGIKPFTTGRVYKQVDSVGSPITIKLIADDNEEWTIYNWQSVSIDESSSCSCFELSTKEEWDKQELLDEAKRRYPVGTVYKHLNSEYTPEINFLVAAKSDYHFDSAGYFQNAIWGGGLDNYYGVVYHDGEWAEILPLKFTTEDGVDIYGDMKTYLVHPYESDITPCHGIWEGNSKAKCDKYFYHKENALAYIEKHKEKTLKDYENMLLTINIDSINAREACWFYRTLKGKEPKLYYTKILQLIADDLNDGWEPDFTNYDEKWCIAIQDIVHYMNLQIHGIVYFKECEFAEKARDILGDKVKYLFN